MEYFLSTFFFFYKNTIFKIFVLTSIKYNSITCHNLTYIHSLMELLFLLVFFFFFLKTQFTYLASLRKGILKQSDRRVKLMNEILSGIKIIKLYCWDIAFANKVQNVRVDEVKLLAKLGLLFVR